jgi:peptidoglycan-associated lipoprotein
MIRKLLMVGIIAVGLSACSTSKDTATVSDISVEEREDITTGPLEGTVVEDRLVQDGPAPGTQQDLVVNVGDRVFFGYDRYDLSREAQLTIERQAEWMKIYSNVNLIIEGHADERGTREYNLALAERRANSIKNYLGALGLNVNRLTVISYGKERPAVLGSNEAAWAQNRRGVIVVE